MKRCARCEVTKIESEFNKCKQKKDGLSVYCRLCKSIESKTYNKNNREKCAEKLRNWREKNPEKSKEYSKTDREKNQLKIIARRKTPQARVKILALVKSWRIENEERFKESQKIYKSKNRFVLNARSLLMKALVRGKMIRPATCEKCMTECKPDGHHTDYSKPLEVQWLCKTCHAQAHGKLLDVRTDG